METELLAQLVEEVSVVASQRQRKKPREVPRPAHVKKGRGGPRHPGQQPGGAESDPFKKAVGVLAATARPRRAA